MSDHPSIINVCGVLRPLYWLSTIPNKSGDDYPSNTMYSHTTFAFTRFYNRRVTPHYTLPHRIDVITTLFDTKSSASKCKWTLSLTVVHTHSHVITWWRVKGSPGSSWRRYRRSGGLRKWHWLRGAQWCLSYHHHWWRRHTSCPKPVLGTWCNWHADSITPDAQCSVNGDDYQPARWATTANCRSRRRRKARVKHQCPTLGLNTILL